MKIIKSIVSFVRRTAGEFRDSAGVLYKAFFPDVNWQAEFVRDDYRMESGGVIRRKE